MVLLEPQRRAPLESQKQWLDETVILELGDKEAVEKTLSEGGNQVAAVIIEPLPANNGLLVQHKGSYNF